MSAVTRTACVPTPSPAGYPRSRPAGLHIRPATILDLTPLSFFFDTMLRDDYFLRRGHLADMLGDAYHAVYVAELDCVLVGIAITTRGHQLVNVLVHPAYRGLGIGRALLSATDVRTVRCQVDISTGDPRPFYGAAGFESTGVRVGKRKNIELLQRAGYEPPRRTGSEPSARKRRRR